MTRIVSFVALVAMLLVVAGLFYQVMIGFLLPLFLAALLVVMFGPVHRWFVSRCKGYDRVAAGLTTLTIVLVFLVPLALVVVMASFEGIRLYGEMKHANIDLDAVADYAVSAATRLGLPIDRAAIEQAVTNTAKQWLTPLILGTTQYLGQTLVSLAVMLISVYYFLVDGPGMIKTLMRLSPLDDDYERQLIDQFTSLSRAVVVATVASAAAQGVLAAIGYWLAGFESVFLMMLLTMLLAMVPFVGAAAVWLPASLWLLATGHVAAGVMLGVYGAAIVSTSDNVIKPMVLQGRSNLHPLLALLSVLGGVQALGPIGIFVGPMAVAFLQTLLNMFHQEMEAIARSDAAKKARAALP